MRSSRGDFPPDFNSAGLPDPASECACLVYFPRPSHPSSRELAMQSSIIGTTMPVLEFTLEPNESIISEAGELSWMSSAIQLTTHTQLGGGGGFFGALNRVAGGGTLFMTEYRAIGG